MYLLKRATPAVKTTPFSNFTFHYVSIKTNFSLTSCFHLSRFTFHYVSIKTDNRVYLIKMYATLHSTMYLLKLKWLLPSSRPYKALHSTMYLLKPLRTLLLHLHRPTLHSTMYLLKLFFMFVNFIRNVLYIPLCIY